tara:strand:- start:105 stop:293 length:189 start_codon:yes stop_codon:yes gene_type:complete
MLEINDFFSNDVLQEYLRSQQDNEDDDLCTVLEKLQEETPMKGEDTPMEAKPEGDDDYKQEA